MIRLNSTEYHYKMSEEQKSEITFNQVTWFFVILLVMIHWGALDSEDVAYAIDNRKRLFIQNILYTLPLNLSLTFAFILATSVKRYRVSHLLITSFFFYWSTKFFNHYGWLSPEIPIDSSSSMISQAFRLLVEYFKHFQLFNFLSAILIGIYFTYFWHHKIMGETDDAKESKS